MSEVFYADLRAESEKDNVPNKIGRLFKKAGLDRTFNKGDLVGVKTHFGERGNTAFLRPQYLAKVVDLVSEKGGRPFLTDSNTLYVGQRANAVDHLETAALHGFTYPVVNAPVVIADGLKGKDEAVIEVNLKRCQTVRVGAAAMQADSIMCVSHLKGHMLTGFGGAMKNLGMGFGSRAGKLDMHMEVSPQVKKDKCRGCGTCVRKCPEHAIKLTKRKANIDEERCIGCGECLVVCPYGAVDFGDCCMDTSAIQEKIVEYCYGIMKGREDHFGFITFVVDVVPYCDCAPFNDATIVPNLGILASKDIVAIDQAAADLVNGSTGLKGTKLKKGLRAGDDKWKALFDFDWTVQLEYGESIGLGERKYDLVKV
jgi:uncharacterized Fe-S center protein